MLGHAFGSSLTHSGHSTPCSARNCFLWSCHALKSSPTSPITDLQRIGQAPHLIFRPCAACAAFCSAYQVSDNGDEPLHTCLPVYPRLPNHARRGPRACQLKGRACYGRPCRLPTICHARRRLPRRIAHCWRFGSGGRVLTPASVGPLALARCHSCACEGRPPERRQTALPCRSYPAAPLPNRQTTKSPSSGRAGSSGAAVSLYAGRHDAMRLACSRPLDGP